MNDAFRKIRMQDDEIENNLPGLLNKRQLKSSLRMGQGLVEGSQNFNLIP
jgi:hypothetical protein